MADCALLKLFVHAETHQDVMGSRRTQVVAISINHQSITIIATGMPLLQTSDQDYYEREWDTMNFHHKKRPIHTPSFYQKNGIGNMSFITEYSLPQITIKKRIHSSK
jgi:hypothetical protein